MKLPLSVCEQKDSIKLIDLFLNSKKATACLDRDCMTLNCVSVRPWGSLSITQSVPILRFLSFCSGKPAYSLILGSPCTKGLSKNRSSFKASSTIKGSEE